MKVAEQGNPLRLGILGHEAQRTNVTCADEQHSSKIYHSSLLIRIGMFSNFCELTPNRCSKSSAELGPTLSLVNYHILEEIQHQ